jgi:hypothetical protein
MNRWNARVWVGVGLVVFGLLSLVERFGFLRGVTSLIWGALLLAAGLFFLYRFVNNNRSEWWAAIPGFALLGLGLSSLSSVFLSGWSGFLFLGMLGLGFFVVYLSRREFWWAIIPGGVFVTLAGITMLSDVYRVSDSGGLVLVGFGLTFILVAVVASLQWAWIPGLILVVIGALIGTPFIGSMNLLWPAALIVGGLLLIFQFVRRR